MGGARTTTISAFLAASIFVIVWHSRAAAARHIAGSIQGEPKYEVSTAFKASKDHAGNFMAITLDRRNGQIYASDRSNIYMLHKGSAEELEIELFVNGSGTPGSARDGPRLSTRREKSSTDAAIPEQELPAMIGLPHGLCVNPCGDLFVADGGNFSVRKVDAETGYVSTVAGQSGHQGIHDGPGPIAQFSTPASLWCLPNGDVYVGDTGERALRLIHSSPGCEEGGKGTSDSARYMHFLEGALAAGGLGLAGWATWTAIALADVPGRIRVLRAHHTSECPSRHPCLSNEEPFVEEEPLPGDARGSLTAPLIEISDGEGEHIEKDMQAPRPTSSLLD